jgi:hypothetical protein
MKETLLNNKIQEIQKNYLDLLKGFDFKNTTQDIFINCVDALNIFWHTHRESVALFLDYHLEDKNTYFHTGNGSFSLIEKSHYTFITLGNLHIIDDPIMQLSSHIQFMPDGKFKKNLIKNIKNRIKDMILIFEHYRDAVTIIPITLCTMENLQNIFSEAENIFFSMFKNESMNREIYFKNFITLDEVQDALKEFIPQLIIFSDDDDIAIDMKIRFHDYLKTKHNPFLETSFTEAQAFIGIVTSYFIQALKISITSITLKATPFIIYFLPFMYFRLIMENFLENPIAQRIVTMATCAHLFNKTFDFRKVKHIDFKDYYLCSQKFDFAKQLSERLRAKGEVPLARLSAAELIQDILEVQKSFSDFIASLYD